MWKQFIGPAPEAEGQGPVPPGALAAIGFAAAAAIAVKLPQILSLPADAAFYLRNAGLLVLPLLAAYFAVKRRLAPHLAGALAVLVIAAAIFVNAYPFAREGATFYLACLHLPMLLWLVVGIGYAGGRWRQIEGRMDFIRFTGEWFIYYVLIALGGVVLTAFTAMIFNAAGISPERFLGQWLVPCGAAGAVIIGAWLVEAKQSVIENMAPVLARLFTPLFAAVLVVFLMVLLVTGRGIIQREILIGFDLLLALVLGLLLYSVSARDPHAPPGLFDRIQVLLVVAALLVDAVALWAIAARIGEFGFTPNRVAALGENIILLVNLAWSALLYLRFLRGGGSFAALERWQTSYLPVYAGWAALVVVGFPLWFKGI